MAIKFYLLLLISVRSIFFTSTISEVSDRIIDSIKKGNAAGIGKNFDSKMNLKIFSKEGIYSNSQAETILSDFFSTHKVTDYTTTHSNTQRNGNEFFSGILTCENGRFGVSFVIKKVNQKYLITQFRIENEKN